MMLTQDDEELNRCVQVAKVSTEFARDWRNRRIAHSDQDVRLGHAKLAEATREKTQRALEDIAACLRRFALVEHDTTLITHPIRQLENDEINLLIALYHGLNHMQNQENLRSSSDDYHRLPSWLTYRPEDMIDL